MTALGGSVAVAGDLKTPGNIADGVTTGTLTISTKAGSVTVALTSFRPPVEVGAPIWYRYRVTAGTGSFVGLHDTGSLRLDWVPAPTPDPVLTVNSPTPRTSPTPVTPATAPATTSATTGRPSPTTPTGTTTSSGTAATTTPAGTMTGSGTAATTTPAGTMTGSGTTATTTPAGTTSETTGTPAASPARPDVMAVQRGTYRLTV